ncbi:MAG: 2'-5' RNA ligase family protein [Pseudomonadota bacterium]|nr:2'-5' RNA ligase family protein [Pseudomonadota bacterium]
MTQAHQAPLILTLALADADQTRFDRLRALHFPPERNHLGAHVTLFHHLPGEDIGQVSATIERCSQSAPFPVAVTGLRSLGRGVAFSLASPELARLHRSLAQHFHADLTAQDRQSFRPHVTIQNKVAPADARALLAHLAAAFTPFEVHAVGLHLWHYRGGPWEHAMSVGFKAPPAAPPAPRHRSPSSAPS